MRDRSTRQILLCPGPGACLRSRRVFFLAGALITLFGAGRASAREGAWVPGFGPQGLNSTVYAVAVYQDQLYAGGDFTEWAGGAAVGIGRWDGSAWQPLGGGLRGFRVPWPFHEPPRITVRALTEFNGELIVGGTFSGAGGEDSPGVAAWNGEEWRPLPGLPMDSTLGVVAPQVEALAVYHGELIAAGDFGSPLPSMGNVARWDGHVWRPLDNHTQHTITCLAVHDGALYAGGIAGIERWDGTGWESISSPSLGGATGALCSFEGRLYAGGEYGLNGVGKRTLLVWDGLSWSPVSVPWDDSASRAVFRLAVVHGILFAGLSASPDGEQPTLYAWDGDRWQSMGREEASGYGMKGAVTAIGATDDGWVVGGHFQQAGSAATANIAVWDGHAWAAFGRTCSPLAELKAATVWNGRTVAAIGSDEDTLNRIVQFDGQTWESIAPPLHVSPLQVDPGVAALGVFRGDLVAAGGFYWGREGGSSCLARFDGRDWHPLGTNLLGQVRTIAVYKDLLIAGGDVLTVDGSAPIGIAAWDGSSWAPLGEGVASDGFWPAVYALCVLDGCLYAAGEFDEAGGVPALNIARWDGSTWSAVGSGLDDAHRAGLRALAGYGHELVAGGYSFRTGAGDVGTVARWDGSEWRTMPATGEVGSFTDVFALSVYNGDLIAGGAGGEGIARWDGSAWHSLDGGVYQDTRGWICDPWPCPATLPGKVSLLAGCRDYLLASGDFTDAGPWPALGVAVWKDEAYPPTVCTFSAARSEGAVTVRWEVVGRLDGASFVLCRRTQGNDRVPVSLNEYAGRSLYEAQDQARPLGQVEYWLELRAPDREPEWVGPALLEAESKQGATPLLRTSGPNPGAGVLMLNYVLPSAGPVRVRLFDLLGRRLATPIEKTEEAGGHSFLLRLEDAGGRPLPTGTYLLAWEALGQRRVNKVTLVR
jgi:trimeric autotransporter adhesin